MARKSIQDNYVPPIIYNKGYYWEVFIDDNEKPFASFCRLEDCVEWVFKSLDRMIHGKDCFITYKGEKLTNI